MGLSCVPLTVSLEILAEACAVLASSTAVCAIENVKAYDWIALDNEELALEVRARVIDSERGIYNASLLNEEGTVVSADIHFSPDWRAQGLTPLQEKRAPQWNDAELYATGMFHGPIFQSIRHIDGWDDTGMDAELSTVSLAGFFAELETPRFVINPVLLDAAGQLAAYWIAEKIGTDFNCFPSTIERIELYDSCPADLAGLTLRARQSSLGAASHNAEAPHSWQFEYLDHEGQPVARITNLVNVHFSVPSRFYEVRRDPLTGWLGFLQPVSPKADVLIWELPNLDEAFCAQSGEIFLRIIAHVFLSFEERAEWRALTGKLGRRREWLLGRACIKEAVRYWIYEQSGHLLYPTDIIVCHDEVGAPFVDGWWRDSLVAAPTVSLSHNKRACVSAVCAPEQPVGVDIEDIGRIQKPELIIETLTPNEHVFLRGLSGEALEEMLLRLWCAKEAAAKFLGAGLNGCPDRFVVSFTDDHAELADVDYAETSVEVILRRDGNTIIAVAVGQSSTAGVH